MKYRIQIYYPVAECFMNTNHESDDLDALKRLARSDIFLGSRIRVVDEHETLLLAPPVRERQGAPTVEDIAAMLDVPVLPPIIIPPDENDEDDDA